MIGYRTKPAAERPGVAAILVELRQELRRQGVRVAHLAERLGVAEPTIWRWLRGRGLTLDRLEQICTILGLDLRDLFARADEEGADRFTLAQERILAADRGLALLFFSFLNGAQRQECEREFGLGPERVDAYIERLHRLGLVDVRPGGRIRPLTSRSVRWRPGGPLAMAFDRTVKHFFLTMDFGASDARYVADMVRLSDAGRARVHALFEALGADIHVIAQQDRAARLDRYDWSAVLMLVRPLDIEEVTRELRQPAG
jgi:transcriptional regulator with XRE-family HTH domain